MIYDKSIANLWKATSKDTTRYSLQAICIDAKRKVAVATDGHMMVVVDISSMLEPAEESFLLPAQALKAATSFDPKGKNIKRPKIYIRKVEAAIVVSMEGSLRSQIFDTPKLLYPDWDKAIPSKSFQKSIALAPGLLNRLYEAVATPDLIYGVALYFDNPDHCMKVALRSGSRTYAVLMPTRWVHEEPTAFWRKP